MTIRWLLLVNLVWYVRAESAENGVTPGSRGTSCQCGWVNTARKGNSGNKIVGGTFYEQNEYPFTVGLARRNIRGGYSAFCGGSIITSNHVITAAHCTDNYMKKKTPLFVLLGTHDRSKPNPNDVTIQVSKISQRGWKEATQENDISILTLSQSIRFNKIIGPVCMPLRGLDVAGQTVRILGWGAERFQGSMTNRPKKLDTTHLKAAACAAAWPQFVRRNNARHICTLSRRETACHGDSGGPVVWLDPQTNRYTLVGLVSFGLACADSRPTVHTRVEPYSRWIQSQISRTRLASTCRKV